jgi:putative ABC transport system permease protein
VAVALGVGTVVSITCFYESVRQAISDQVVTHWVGKSHLTIESPLGHWGHIGQDLASSDRGLGNVPNVAHVTYHLKRVVTATLSEPGEALQTEAIVAIGIDPATDYVFREYRNVNGRLIEPGERGVAVIESGSAAVWNRSIGDTLELAVSGAAQPRSFRIVGTHEIRRVAEFQRPTVLLALEDLQDLKGEHGEVTAIDLMLADSSPEALAAAADRVRDIVDDWNRQTKQNVQVSTAETKLAQLREAERVTRLTLTLVAFVALLTSFFIILTTMSMGLVERISVMGMMRCVGVTRQQMALLVLIEVLPVGLIGVLGGVPIGLGLAKLGALLVPQYVQGVVISVWGLWLAVIGGAITTLAAAAILLVQVSRVSPLEAANPEAKPARIKLAVGAALIGVVSLAIHQSMINNVEAAGWFQPVTAFSAVATLYLGYVLLAPVLVLLAGTVIVHLASAVLRIRQKLARDQIGRSPWRAAAVCWMLMVGLSLIVYIAVRSESIIAAWDFPKKLPATFVWSPDPVPYRVMDEIRKVPGVGETTAVYDIPCKVGDPEQEATSFLESLKKRMASPVPATFVAGELDTFLAMTKLGFLQGDLDNAVAKLRQGGYVLLPPESARTYGLDVGDCVTLSVGSRSHEFEVAGVVESPALDIAVTYFQADSYMMLAAAGSFLGTLDDAREHFGTDHVTMFMLNAELDDTPTPTEFHADTPPVTAHLPMAQSILNWADRLPLERQAIAAVTPQLKAFVTKESPSVDLATLQELNRFAQAVNDTAKFWTELDGHQRWRFFREQLVLRNVAYRMGRPSAMTGSLRTLKEAIDGEIREATLLMSAMPAIALLVAALGVANLMMVNVNARSKQIAVIRAVGGTKSQITRLVLAEALTLGLLGSVIGVVLGLHASGSANVIAAKLIGFELGLTIPWHRVAGGMALTVGACLVAGIMPARHAARNNIVEAMTAV